MPVIPNTQKTEIGGSQSEPVPEKLVPDPTWKTTKVKRRDRRHGSSGKTPNKREALSSKPSAERERERARERERERERERI
jgi:hypothetical protein